MAWLRQERLRPRLQQPVPHRRRGTPPRPHRGPCERERAPAGGVAPRKGSGRRHRAGASGRGQRLRVPGGVRPPRLPQDRPRNRLEAAEGQGDPT